MNSIVNEIEKISCNHPLQIDPVNYNRYMVVTQNSDRTKTAYCFSVPIYNEQLKNVVDLKFHHNKFESYCLGSSATITIADTAHFKNNYGSCRISSFGKITKRTNDTIYMDSATGCIEITPTLNGLLFKAPCSVAQESTIQIAIDCSIESVKSNDKYFAIMRAQYIPFITVSSVGTMNNRGQVIAPCEISFEAVNDKEYVLTIKSKSKLGKFVSYEINMHEAKLFEDTTVESQHPTMNNAFGGTAFLGKTKYFGEQWLYSRLNLSILPQLHNKKVLKAVLHIPKLNNGDCLLVANRILTRFCSFGSNWENKIGITEQFAESIISNGYQHLDITELVRSISEKSGNFVVLAKAQKNKLAVLSTGDSYYHPQILEINYE